ncbi:MAG: PQQ-binding-like beta-propeller repeat protein [Ardenticatenaceae bacterium]|nr:PQQ-binding-like beta-propeller repeat protein [Ardenticatenaceae bacterium]MCB9446508.1 PQQ-binding-like beta-propeller repeat protein [Ardenticatenaceae bacterium]
MEASPNSKINQADRSAKQMIGVAMIVLTICLCCFQFFPVFFPKCDKTSGELREIISVENFEGNWSISEIFLSASDSAVFMAANENRILLYGTIDVPCGDTLLLSIDTDSGEFLNKGTLRIFTTGVYRTAYNSDYFFVGYIGFGKIIPASTEGVGGIAAYEINTGELRWVRKITGNRTVISLVADDTTISVDGIQSQYHLIDAQTGEFISSLDKPSEVIGSVYATNMAYWYDHVTNTSLPEQEPDIQNIAFWAERFGNVFQPPVLSDGVLLVRRGVGTSLGDVAALNGETGDLIWETEKNVVSNVAVDGAVAFFVTSQAELVALDVETGQKVGSVQFSNGETQLGEDKGYFVAASGGNVFVYLGDGRQLFAFHFLADE